MLGALMQSVLGVSFLSGICRTVVMDINRLEIPVWATWGDLSCFFGNGLWETTGKIDI